MKVIVQMFLFVPHLADFRWNMGQQVMVPDLDHANIDQRINLEKCLTSS